MVTAEAIEQAVAGLPVAELAKFRQWFVQFDAAAWDAQMDTDAKAGKLDALAEKALDEYRRGEAREL